MIIRPLHCQTLYDTNELSTEKNKSNKLLELNFRFNVKMIPVRRHRELSGVNKLSSFLGLFTKLCHFVPFFKKFLLIWILSEK